MPSGFPNKPRILRGAFVEFGLSLPPLVVVFQFNPLQLTRNRSLTYAVPNPPRASAEGTGAAPAGAAPTRTLRQFHGQFSDLLDPAEIRFVQKHRVEGIRMPAQQLVERVSRNPCVQKTGGLGGVPCVGVRHRGEHRTAKARQPLSVRPGQRRRD